MRAVGGAQMLKPQQSDICTAKCKGALLWICWHGLLESSPSHCTHRLRYHWRPTDKPLETDDIVAGGDCAAISSQAGIAYRSRHIRLAQIVAIGSALDRDRSPGLTRNSHILMLLCAGQRCLDNIGHRKRLTFAENAQYLWIPRTGSPEVGGSELAPPFSSS